MAVWIAFLVISIVFFSFLKLMRAKWLQLENARIKSYMASMEELYAGILHRIDTARRFRHDLAGHIQMLESILEKEADEPEIDKLRVFMETQQKQYRQLKDRELCEDEFLDTILRIKKDECRRRGIPVEITVEDGCFRNVAEVDQVALLFNLLDNAIEATERIPQGEKTGITLRLGKEAEQVRIAASNYVRPGKKITFHTQKAAKEEHGFGTQIIESLVEKYHGTRKLWQDEKEWILYDRIILCPENGKEK